MNTEKINYLHKQYISGRISESELEEWEKVIKNPSLEHHILNLIENSWKNIPDDLLVDMNKKDSAILLSKITQSRAKTKFSRQWLSYAAAIVVLLCISVLVTYLSINKSRPSKFDSATHILPGKVGATLILSNGKHIALTKNSQGELAQQAGVRITQNSKGELTYTIESAGVSDNAFNTLSTAAGETYQVILPDGTHVWLNALSNLTYNAKLIQQGKRLVKLSGEAYFEVAKNEKIPFFVETNKQQIRVLGTHFNVNSYPDENYTRTTLLEGKVEVNTSGGIKGVLLPGQYSALRNGILNIGQADIDLAIAWKNNKFMFDNASIKEVMSMVGRWYNVEIVYETVLPADRFGGSVSRFEDVSKVLEMLQSTKKVHFRVEGRRIYVSK